MKPKKQICFVHDDIKGFLLQALGLLENDKKQLAMAKINSALRLLVYAKEKGQSMENRLNVYRKGIEDMGFKRKK